MKLLGIDYGRRKIGLAMGDTETKFAEPLKTLKFQDFKILVGELRDIVNDYEIKKIVVGVSEGKMAEETKKFGKELEEIIKVPVVFQDETLTTREAQELSIEAGIKRKKRKEMEDAYAAAIILQNYLNGLL